MSYVVYDVETTKIMATYPSKRGTTRFINKTMKEGYNKIMGAAPAIEFFEKIEKYKEVKSLMSGETVRIKVNTPISCDPSMETYWSM